MSLGYRVQQLRKQRKMSQEELGEKLEVTRQTVSKWELDQSTPDLDYISAISDLFGVTTDYLIKGEAKPSAEYADAKRSAPVLEKTAENAGISYCEKSEEYGMGQPVISLDTASAAAEKYVVTLRINFKAVFKIIVALAAMFFGFMGCILAISFMAQPHIGFGNLLGSSFLFIIGVFVFTAGLSAFAEPLMKLSRALVRFSKTLNMMWSYICNFGKDFTCTFKKVKAERMPDYEKTPESGEVAGEKRKASFIKRLMGLFLMAAGCYAAIFFIYMIAHFYDGWDRNYFLLITEFGLMLASLAGAYMGLKMFLRSSKEADKIVEEDGAAADAADKKAERLAAAARRKEEKALKIREQAEIKAALIMEKNRLRAEKIAPVNEAKAEKIMEKSKIIEAQIMEKAERRADIILNGRFSRGGAHIK